MEGPIVLVTTFDRFAEVKEELGDVLNEHNILIRFMTEEAFQSLLKK
jgi:hypothetical protein